MKGSGVITIGDAPIQSADFDKIKKISGINEIVDFYEKYARF